MSKIDERMAALLVVVLLFSAAYLVINLAWTSDALVLHQREAVEHGYALYCPLDGKLAWVGECAE